MDILRPAAIQEGTYCSLVRRTPYVSFAGRSSDSASSRRRGLLDSKSMAQLRLAPPHSSGPVGELHSVPFSPAPCARTPANALYSLFKIIVAQNFALVKPFLGSACQKQVFDKLVDGGASSPATATPRCRVKIFDFAVGSFAFGET